VAHGDFISDFQVVILVTKKTHFLDRKYLHRRNILLLAYWCIYTDNRLVCRVIIERFDFNIFTEILLHYFERFFVIETDFNLSVAV
jgi:hypothetical protein